MYANDMHGFILTYVLMYTYIYTFLPSDLAGLKLNEEKIKVKYFTFEDRIKITNTIGFLFGGKSMQ